jgi:hypothetical protein
LEQKIELALKELRWALLKDRSKLSANDLDTLVAQFPQPIISDGGT